MNVNTPTVVEGGDEWSSSSKQQLDQEKAAPSFTSTLEDEPEPNSLNGDAKNSGEEGIPANASFKNGAALKVRAFSILMNHFVPTTVVTSGQHIC